MPSKNAADRKNDVKAYKERYERVNEFEIEETRAATMELKYRQFWALLGWARDMGWQTSKPEEVDEVRRRWASLRTANGR